MVVHCGTSLCHLGHAALNCCSISCCCHCPPHILLFSLFMSPYLSLSRSEALSFTSLCLPEKKFLFFHPCYKRPPINRTKEDCLQCDKTNSSSLTVLFFVCVAHAPRPRDHIVEVLRESLRLLCPFLFPLPRVPLSRPGIRWSPSLAGKLCDVIGCRVGGDRRCSCKHLCCLSLG